MQKATTGLIPTRVPRALKVTNFAITNTSEGMPGIKAKINNMFISSCPTDPKFIDQPLLFYCHFQVHIFIVQINNGRQSTECIDVAIKYHNSASSLV